MGLCLGRPSDHQSVARTVFDDRILGATGGGLEQGQSSGAEGAGLCPAPRPSGQARGQAGSASWISAKGGALRTRPFGGGGDGAMDLADCEVHRTVPSTTKRMDSKG